MFVRLCLYIRLFVCLFNCFCLFLCIYKVCSFVPLVPFFIHFSFVSWFIYCCSRVNTVILNYFLFALLLFQQVFQTIQHSIMTMFVMTLGELNYADTFLPWEELQFPAAVNILFVLFVLGMPIILMNMLVS